MTTETGLTKAIATLSLMKFFPSDPYTRTALIELLAEMCHTDEQAIWLAKRTVQLHNEWPGAHELRATLCSKFRPRDGIEVYSAIYPGGVPSETGRLENAPALMLESGVMPVSRQLPAGHVASADPEAEDLIGKLVESSAMPALRRLDADGKRVDAELRRLYHEAPETHPPTTATITGKQVDEAREKELERRTKEAAAK